MDEDRVPFIAFTFKLKPLASLAERPSFVTLQALVRFVLVSSLGITYLDLPSPASRASFTFACDSNHLENLTLQLLCGPKVERSQVVGCF